MVFQKKQPIEREESEEELEVPVPEVKKKPTARYAMGQVATQVENVVIDTKTNEQIVADVEILNKLDKIEKAISG